MAAMTRVPALALALVFALVLACGGACRQVGKLLNDEEVERFRKEGIASGQGLVVPEIPVPDLRSKEEPVPVRQAPVASAPPPVEAILRARLQCKGNAACLDETRVALGKVGDPGAGEMLDIALSTKPIDLRVEAVRVMGWLRIGSARTGLQRLLVERDPLLAREAIWSLGQLGDPGAVDVLAEQLGARDAQIREAAAHALGNIPTAESVAALTGAWSRSDDDLRAVIASALGRTGRQEAARALQAALQDANALVRAEARTALARFGDFSSTQ